MTGTRLIGSLLLALALLAAYSNHFGNDFQFDDRDAVRDNPAIREPATIVKAFADTSLFSKAPEQRNYRPVTTASLALDYWLAGGLDVFYFHLSTFCWYSVEVLLLWLLFERLMDLADPHPSNRWVALAAAAAYGLHPVNAETVNYIIQRADLYNALGCVAALWLFIRFPAQRKFGWYLLPAALAMLAKAPALIFPLLLVAYLGFFEKGAMRAAAPAAALAVGAAFLLARMQPHTWVAGTVTPSLYRMTQPYAALHYFKSFFLPTDLNIDPGWHYLAPLSIQALAGYLFVLGLLAAAAVTARIQSTKPVAFGILWFLVTLLPTSLMPLGDITNDHRMFFAFVGLTLAVFWSLRLALFRLTGRLTTHRGRLKASAAILAVLLIVAGAATRARNRVWHTPESLWRDSVAKNPRNFRALTNYGYLAFAQGDYQTALPYWERAAALDPTCYPCQTNLLRVALALHRSDLAERCLGNIVAMNPANPAAYIANADWLSSQGRYDEGMRMLDRAAQLATGSDALRRARMRLLTARDAADRILLFRKLDSNHDTRLSGGEMIAAPSALLTLDRNGDGKLSPEECGADRTIMLSDPLLRALDANHDGEISAAEIAGAERALEALDRDGDGMLEAPELAPEYLLAAARRVMTTLDANHDGRIGPGEWTPGFLGLLKDADIDGDGAVTLEELVNEILYRADRNRDGVVTREEMDAALRSGLIGP